MTATAERHPADASAPRPAPWRRLAVFAAGSWLASLESSKFLAFYDAFGVDWPAEWLAWHRRMWELAGPAPNRYRWLTTALGEGLQRLGLPAFDAYLAIRFLATLGTCLVLDRLWRRWLGEAERLAGVGLFLLVAAIGQVGLIQPAEPLNVLLFAAGCLCLAGRSAAPLRPHAAPERQPEEGAPRWAALYALLALGALNKLTVLFLAPLVLFDRWLARDRRLAAVGLAALAAAVVVGVRLAVIAAVGSRPYATSLWKASENLAWMASRAEGWSFVLVGVAPAAAVWASWRRQPRLVRAGSLVLPLFVAGHFAVTLVAEIRTFAVTLVLGLPGLLIWLRGDGADRR